MRDALKIDGPKAYADVVRQSMGRAYSLIASSPGTSAFGRVERKVLRELPGSYIEAQMYECVNFFSWIVASPHIQVSPELKERTIMLAGAVMKRWSFLQYRNGGFDHGGATVRNWMTTASGAFHMALAMERLQKELSYETATAVKQGLYEAGIWLTRKTACSVHSTRQLAAAAAACEVIGDVLGISDFEKVRERFLGRVYQLQNTEEGWYGEPSSVDAGDQSRSIYYLAEVWKRTRDLALLGSLKKACEFCSWFAHPDGYLGGAYASREAQAYLPSGFELLAKDIDCSAGIALHFRKILAKQPGFSPTAIHAGLFFPVLNSYVQAIDHKADIRPVYELPWKLNGAARYFAQAGLFISNRGGRKFVLSVNNGGALKLWSLAEGTLLYEDCGYLDEDGRRSSVSQNKPETSQVIEGSAFEAILEGHFKEVADHVSRFGILSTVKRLIGQGADDKGKAGQGRWVRKVRFSRGGVLEIDDDISGTRGEVSPSVSSEVRGLSQVGRAPVAETPCPEVLMNGGSGVRTVRIDGADAPFGAEIIPLRRAGS